MNFEHFNQKTAVQWHERSDRIKQRRWNRLDYVASAATRSQPASRPPPARCQPVGRQPHTTTLEGSLYKLNKELKRAHSQSALQTAKQDWPNALAKHDLAITIDTTKQYFSAFE